MANLLEGVYDGEVDPGIERFVDEVRQDELGAQGDDLDDARIGEPSGANRLQIDPGYFATGLRECG